MGWGVSTTFILQGYFFLNYVRCVHAFGIGMGHPNQHCLWVVGVLQRVNGDARCNGIGGAQQPVVGVFCSHG